ncbi:integrase catalytic domain-containing protein [Trichonephila clavipes]|nr:integrase catalytic domain-containing protein [Trichonephila clavipes]
MIVLAWLRKEPMYLKTFVQNRVAKIQELYPNQLWRHVPFDQNPADLVSRGVDPDKFLQQNLWFNGPTFLSGEKAANIIIYLNDEDLKNYDKIKSIILQEFEPTPQSCLENFKKATRQNCESHVQFASRLTTNWEYYLKLRNVSNFEKAHICIHCGCAKNVSNDLINPDQRKLQRILWRENMDEPIKTFELSTVTYGTTSAPFLATRTLKQLALDEAGNFPLGSSVVMSDMYIDDVLTGAETLLEAKELKNQLINIFAKGGPVVAKAKIFLQKLWMLKIDWTDLLPDTINREWRQFVESLQVVNDININRCIVVEQPEVIELHGFSDASQSAYGAVVYCKSITSDRKMLVHLIASKSRVAPTKQTTIPRLELYAAVLLAKLVHRVKQALKLNVTNTFLWSDSMIVLSWIRKESYQLKTFVANRIATIQEITSSEQWRYVATEDNPADFVSRGMDSLKLKTCELWWNGPKFLMSNQYPQRQIPVAVIKDPGELKNCSDFSNFFLILLLTLL